MKSTLRFLLTLFTILACATISSATIQESQEGVVFEKTANSGREISFPARINAPKTTVFGPHTGAGPLGQKVAGTFRGGKYTQSVTSDTTTLYRVHGGKAGEMGPYWTRTKPAGPLQSRMDSALLPEWGNTANRVSTIQVPKGTTIFEGAAAPQGSLLGGGNQVFIPKVDSSWLVK